MATFSNIATLSYNNTTVNSNIVTGELQEVLAASKSSIPGTYTTDEAITYVVSIVNSGTNAFTGLTVTDDLGAYVLADETTTVYPLTYVVDSARYYVDGVLQATPTVTAGPPLVFTGINVPAGSNALLLYQARTNAFAPLAPDSTIVNNATVSGGGLSEDVIGTATINLSTEPVLRITKALEPTVVTDNGEITYTFTISNYSTTPAVATDSVTLTDTFDPIIDINSVTLDGAPWTVGTNYTYNTATGLFTTVPGAITVPAATTTQNADGTWSITPGTATLIVSGTV